MGWRVRDARTNSPSSAKHVCAAHQHAEPSTPSPIPMSHAARRGVARSRRRFTRSGRCRLLPCGTTAALSLAAAGASPPTRVISSAYGSRRSWCSKAGGHFSYALPLYGNSRFSTRTAAPAFAASTSSIFTPSRSNTSRSIAFSYTPGLTRTLRFAFGETSEASSGEIVRVNIPGVGPRLDVYGLAVVRTGVTTAVGVERSTSVTSKRLFWCGWNVRCQRECKSVRPGRIRSVPIRSPSPPGWRPTCPRCSVDRVREWRCPYRGCTRPLLPCRRGS